jgi:hypothetical protein
MKLNPKFKEKNDDEKRRALLKKVNPFFEPTYKK